MNKRPTKFNRSKKPSKREAIKMLESDMTSRATDLILSYNQNYENQIANLKQNHSQELEERKRKYKKVKSWLIAAIVVLVLSNIALLIWAI